MYAVSSDSQTYSNPVAVAHQGKAIYVVTQVQADRTQYYYNVLNPSILSNNDSFDWEGYNLLTFPSVTALAGYNLLRVPRSESFSGCFSVVSDQKYVYLFRCSNNRIYASRFTLVEVPDTARVGQTNFELQQAWEVRYRRSGKPDTPANNSDSQSFLNMENVPFREPEYLLALDGVDGPLEITNGTFSVEILPTNQEGEEHWLILAVNTRNGTLSSYTFKRSDNGWFDIRPEQYNSQRQTIVPDATVSLYIGTDPVGGAVSFSGVPSSTVYAKQEPVLIGEEGRLQLRDSFRLRVIAPATTAQDRGVICSLDIGISAEGQLACLSSGEVAARSFEAGCIEPVNYSLAFRNSHVSLPSDSSGIILGSSFVQQAWVYPQETGLGRSYIFGCSGSCVNNLLPPSLWIQNQTVVGFGFGDGTTFTAGTTDQGVLQLNTWSNVIAVFDAQGYRIYINGNLVGSNGSSFSGKIPANSVLNSIGQGGPTEDKRFFYGIIDEARIWSSSAGLPTAIQYVYSEIPQDQIPSMPDLIAYWRFDEGTGTVAHNMSSRGSSLDGTLVGAKWVSNHAPMQSAYSEKVYRDAKTSLTCEVGLIDPARQQPSFSQFGALKTGSHPLIFDSADGFLHLYYQGINDDFYVAQYSSSAVRAQFEVPWISQAASPSDTQVGSLYFGARIAGVVSNNGSVSLTQDPSNQYLCAIALDDGMGRKEVWRGVPRKVGAIEAILGGDATEIPGQQSTDRSKVFYDYSGTRSVGYQSYGPTGYYGTLLFISDRLQTVTTLKSQGLVSSKFVFSLGPNNLTFTKSFLNLPSYAEGYLLTLRGLNPSYNYNSPLNTGTGESSVYSLAATRGEILVYIPDPRVTAASFTLSASSSGNSSNCNFSLTLTVDGQPLTVNIPDISRESGEFIRAIESSSSEVARKLVLRYRGAESSPVADQTVQTQCGLLGVVGLFEVYRDGPDAELDSFTLTLTRGLQGVTVNSAAAVLDRGSLNFLPYSSPVVKNGFPRVIDFRDQSISGQLLIAGKDGGWIAESPRNAVQVPVRSGLRIETIPPQVDALNIPGDLTVEGWIRPESPFSMTEQKPATPSYPRLVMGNPVGATGSQYMLGTALSYALQFVSETTVETVDTTDRDAVAKLFVRSDYTVQFYLKVNLETIPTDTPQYIYSRFDVDGQSNERITIRRNGTLSLTLTFSDGSTRSLDSTLTLASERWTFITITRFNGEVALYINGNRDVQIADAAESSYTENRITLGGNLAVVSVEFELNQFSIWNRALGNLEIADRYLKPIAPSTDNLVLLWGFDDGNQSGSIINRAQSTGGSYNTTVTPRFFWDYPGVFYSLFAAARDLAMRTTIANIPEAHWAHIAAVYNMHFGIRTGGPANAHADCGNDSSFDVSEAFSIECWVHQTEATPTVKQVIFSKYGGQSAQQSFEFGLNTSNKPYLRVRVTGRKNVQDRENFFEFTSINTITTSRPTFIAVSFAIEEQANQDTPDVTTYKVSAQFTIDGTTQSGVTFSAGTDPVVITRSSTRVNIGRSNPEGAILDQAHFQGTVSDLSFWQAALSSEIIGSHFRTRRKITSEDGLISAWYFTEQQGRVAADSNFQNHAVLSSSDVWTTFPASATMDLYINGEKQTTQAISLSELGGYGDTQMRFGSMVNSNGGIISYYKGAIDEIRLWSIARTGEQISDSMYNYLIGNEEGLNGYWKFDVGSGSVVVDSTGNGNNATFIAGPSSEYPTWISSNAPINNEAPPLINVLGGISTPFSRAIQGAPAVVEYADTQYDSYGNLFSVIKRSYIYCEPLGSVTSLKRLTGFKIGDLNQIYLGQIQTDPTIVGYIEGAPPLPSENLTRPFYADPTKPSYLAYYNNSSVSLVQEEGLEVSYTSSRFEGDQIAFQLKLAFEFEKKKDAVLGLPPIQSAVQVVKVAGSLGGTFSYQQEKADESGSALKSKVSSASTNKMYNCGDWELPDSDGTYYLRTGERMFFPNNEGVALVKSATADMYALYLKSTATLVGFTVVPNKDIPVDVNYIYFPINPLYTKNGTLDGKLGLQNDPHYPDANQRRGSYFKPLEAYALKRRVEAESAQLSAYYNQYDAAKKGKSKSIDLSQVTADNGLYDWNDESYRKSMYSTYVWTAAGGLYNESSGYTSLIQESLSGKFSSTIGGGPLGSIFFATPFGGIRLEASAVFSKQLTYNVHKAREKEAAIKLDVSADPDGYLGKYLGYNNVPAFSPIPEPGKVDNYRFMSFFLSSSQRNVEELFSKVIDPNWLQNSGDPRAKALLQARARSTGSAWRVLHRVTFVSRIPPQFQLFPDDSTPLGLEEPVNVPANQLLIAMVDSILPPDSRTPEAIGNAVRQVLQQNLRSTIPWWSQYVTDAATYNSAEYKNFNQLVQDTVLYLNQYYTTLG